ncbi:MAG TPA: FGLLP motif-containing membrane protein [Frankiaceae bacterium]|nr:FGLLP motif-containing membrane protein [Frankiaceae bacterium]
MRTLLVALLVAASAAPAAAAQVPEPPPVAGSWLLTFTPDSVRRSGDSIGRDGDMKCGSASCGASYQFSEGGTGAGQRLETLVRFDAAGCTALPCELRSVPIGDGGFVAPVGYDGTTYRATGKWFYASARACERYLPDGTDTLTFTVDGPAGRPALSGRMTALLAYVGPTNRAGKCTDITGYEVYSGRVTGRPAVGNPGFAGGGAGGATPGAPATPGATTAAGAENSAVAAAARADDAAARAHSRPVLSTRVATARQLPWTPSRLAVSALLALLLVVLMPFPAALFNATLEENYDEVRGWLRLPKRRAAPAADAGEPRRAWPRFLLLTGGVAVVGAFLDPGLRLDSASLLLVAGLALAAVALSLLAAAPGHLYVRRRYGDGARLALYPLGLAVAAFCVLVSRLTSFEPGYLYGVVAGFAVARELRTDEKGRLSLVTSGALLAVAAAAFAVRVPVHDAVLRGGGWPLALLDTVLAALFAAGVEANVLGLLPLRFLPGETLYRWSRAVWGAVFGVNVFAFLHALSAAAGDARTGASVVTAAALFGVFATVSVTFWAYFRFRPRPAPA